MKLLFALITIVLLALLVRSAFFSFRAQKPSDYAQTGPAFDLIQTLSGDILSEGIIYGPTGKVESRFNAKMRGDWDGDTGTLTEQFTYSNGSTQSRKWFLTKGQNGAFTATADDIVGTATGQTSGATIMMQYKIILPETAGGGTGWM